MNYFNEYFSLYWFKSFKTQTPELILTLIRRHGEKFDFKILGTFEVVSDI